MDEISWKKELQEENQLQSHLQDAVILFHQLKV